MPRKAAKPAAPPPATDIKDRVIDATMALAAGRGWVHVTRADIAAEAGLSLADLYRLYPSKLSILSAFSRRSDAAVLARPAAADEPVRDRLFDLIMRRIDAMAPHKAALKSIAAGLPRDPAAALCYVPRFLGSMAWLTEAAGLDTSGLLGPLRVKAVAAVYLAALRAWFADESPDHAKTMAALDRALKRAEMVARSLPGFSRQEAAPAAP